jgi:TrmH family RNA methyltransferase
MNSLPLNRFRVVLVGTKIPENIGSTARLLENFGVGEAGLVAPRCEWRTGPAQWVATQSSRERLNRLPVYSGLREAVADCPAVIGFTARSGKVRRLSLKLEDVARTLPGRVALVFGREDYCLSSDEIGVCTHLCALDTSPEFPALNLSHSVAVVLASLFNQENSSRKGHTEGVPIGELEPLFGHLRELLAALGYQGQGNPDRVLSRLKKIYQRSGLSRAEIELLRGICSKTIARCPPVTGQGSRRRAAPDPG